MEAQLQEIDSTKPFFIENNSTKDKYRKVIENQKHPVANKHEIYVTNGGRPNKYFGYGAEFLLKNPKEALIIKATGKAISKAFLICELLKHRISGLYQISNVQTVLTTEKYIALEEGLDDIEIQKRNTVIEITLSKEQLDKSHYGYQSPLPASEVNQIELEDLNNRKKPIKEKEEKENKPNRGGHNRGRRGGRRGGGDNKREKARSLSNKSENAKEGKKEFIQRRVRRVRAWRGARTRGRGGSRRHESAEREKTDYKYKRPYDKNYNKQDREYEKAYDRDYDRDYNRKNYEKTYDRDYDRDYKNHENEKKERHRSASDEGRRGNNNRWVRRTRRARARATGGYQSYRRPKSAERDEKNDRNERNNRNEEKTENKIQYRGGFKTRGAHHMKDDRFKTRGGYGYKKYEKNEDNHGKEKKMYNEHFEPKSEPKSDPKSE